MSLNYYNPIAAPTFADMRTLEALDGQPVYLFPTGEWFLYDGSSLAADDGKTIAKPSALSALSPGRYLVQPVPIPKYTKYTPATLPTVGGAGIQATKDMWVYITPAGTPTLSLAGTQTGLVNIQTSPDNVTYTIESDNSGSLGGGITVAVGLTAGNSGVVVAFVNKGHYYKLVSGSSGVTPTIKYVRHVEIG